MYAQKLLTVIASAILLGFSCEAGRPCKETEVPILDLDYSEQGDSTAVLLRCSIAIECPTYKVVTEVCTLSIEHPLLPDGDTVLVVNTGVEDGVVWGGWIVPDTLLRPGDTLTVSGCIVDEADNRSCASLEIVR